MIPVDPFLIGSLIVAIALVRAGLPEWVPPHSAEAGLTKQRSS